MDSVWYGAVCKAGTRTDEQRRVMTDDELSQAARKNETVKGNGGF